MSIETEIKLTLDPGICARVAELDPIVQYAQAPPEVHLLTSMYYDTKGFALLAKRFALRIRKDGDHIVQTVKGRREAADLLHARVEYEWELAAATLDLSLLPKEAPFTWLQELGEGVLHEVFRTVFQRTAWLLEPEPGILIECALDIGHVTAGGQQTPFCEVELELKAGEPRHVLALAKTFSEALPLRIEQISKAQRGYALVTSRPLPRPVRASRLALPQEATAGEAFQRILDATFHQVVSNEQPVRLNDDPEGVHQMRVGVRRFRAALQAFSSFVSEADRKMLKKQLKPFLTQLGAVRDWDVLAEYAQSTSPKLLASLRKEQSLHRAQLRAAMDQPAYTRMLLAMACWIADLKVDQAASETDETWAVPILQKGHEEILNRGRKLKKLTLPELHRLRLACKQQRYQLEFFEALLFPDSFQPYLRMLQDLQSVLGDLNDTESILARHAAAIKKLKGRGGRKILFKKAQKRRVRLMKKLSVVWAAFKQQERAW
jgi:triphosphatase